MYLKRYFLLFFSAFFFCILSNAALPREEEIVKEPPALLEGVHYSNIKGDYSFFWDKDHEWNPVKDRAWYRFQGMGENIYAISVQNFSRMSLMVFDYENGKFKFVKTICQEINGFDFEAISDPFIFYYNENYYVYLVFNKYLYDLASGQLIYQGKAAAWFYAKSLKKEAKWHLLKYVKSDEETPVYRDACVIGDKIYLVYDSRFDDDYDFHYYSHEVHVKKAYFNEDKELKIIDTYTLDVDRKSSQHPYQITWFSHPDGSPRLLIAYSAEKTKDKENKGGGVVIFNTKTHKYGHIYKSDYPFSVRVAKGTIKGGDSNPRGNPDIMDRIQVFYNHFTDGHWDGLHWISDKGHFYYHTYAIKEGYPLIAKGEIHLENKDAYPDEWDRMNLSVNSLLVPYKDDDIENYNARAYYRQRIWMFFTDKHGYVRGRGFKSDSWHCIKDRIVHSEDLNKVDKYGEKIKKTWSLIGLIEGAPPCPVDWDIWHEHNANLAPTSLKYVEQSEISTTFSVESEEQWYIGVNLNVEAFDYSLKFAKTFIQENGRTHKTTSNQTITFELKENNQKNGILLYLVPVVYRFPYAIFPWWENDYSDKNKSKAPVVYRFVSEKGQIKEIDVPLEKFGIDSDRVNDADMSVWTTEGNPDRSFLVNARDYGASVYSYWLSDGGREDGGFEDLTETEVSSSSNSEVEFDIGYDVVPEVFKVSTGGKFSFTQSMKVTASLAKGIEVSLDDLTEDDKGPKISGYYFTTFWLYKDLKNSDLWYLKNRDLVPEGSYPWYVGYVVTDIEPKTNEKGTESSSRFSVIEGKQIK
ncbi:hypothetical protein TTHT_2028 [Thermotomaculum hydrothermale]|uniref:Uncharacterized protein n=1 Tax=Thermotomaculum hydrothermale TaxID=981385 RepID=A0A7R6PGU0_9BACT|nr:hypothetical protein [Thermotomaculum hydrothermale]BBB33469.1 hypothetical protein TTHT_2028 [Thermotomaculum hydrothermale]